MISRWAICSSRPETDRRPAPRKPLARFLLITALPLFSLSSFAATLTGRVELRDSSNPAVRKRLDYSGVVISLKPVQGLPALESHLTANHGAELHAAQIPEAKATMLQKDKTFSPHLLAIPVGASVDFPNLDPIFHNAFSSYNGQMFDVGLYPPGSSRKVRFTREGVVRVFCNIHASMSAVIVVLGTPYFATTRQNGSFEIPAVPSGEYQLSVFHEHA